MSVHADAMAHLHHVVERAAHYLPAQGPISVFVHHNTLHAFQHLPFEKAVLEAAQLFQAEPYLTEETYRNCLRSGRLREADLDVALAKEADAEVVPGLRRRALWRAMLAPGVRHFDAAGISWRLEEGDLAADFQDPALRALFEACLARTEQPLTARTPAVRAGDEEVHPLLIRLCAVYLDQGLSYWPMPGREQGFYMAVRTLLSQPAGLTAPALSGLESEFRRQAERNAAAADVLIELLGPEQSSWESRLREELLAMPGWPGLIWQLERDPALFPHNPMPCSLLDYLAVRLTMSKVATANIEGSCQDEAVDPQRSRFARAALLYDAARLVHLTADTVNAWSSHRWTRFVVEVESFPGVERRRVYHAAYEHWHEQEILLGLASHRKFTPPQKFRLRPAAQVFLCIDDREESIRRAMEEVDPLVETYSAAGFYGVAVDYKGIDDAHGVSLCPVAVEPQHAVRERPAEEHQHLYEQRVVRRRLWASLSRGFSVSSRSLVRGALSTAALGTLSSIPLIARILAPRRYAKLREALNRAFFPEPRTEVTLMRRGADSQNKVRGLLLGFSKEEKADCVAGVLLPAGLVKDLARIVVILGHGSTSLNNPHESAYDCGACGGRSGGPNARLFAGMANHPDVRQALLSRGVRIPEDTWFVGGVHDTCSDKITLFDIELVPPTHHVDLGAIVKTLDMARARNAQERTRRFASCPEEVTPDNALRHVEARAGHLAEPRPEYGHSSNAVTIIGRRSITKGLFLDRRAFLVSYDPAIDPEQEFLVRLMAAAVPVCAGISLEYYFSTVDNQRYGCGTKLPHNVVGLVGVMDGQASDLRTGLTLQMVEIHEPVRSLFVIETTPAGLERVIAGNALVKELIGNRWVRVAVMDPLTGGIQVRRDGVYEDLRGEVNPLPVTTASCTWYQGKRDHIGLAAVQAAGTGRAVR
ncbi:MAG TPA: DUF2309 domain-containing protein [Bryobacteraceae bacterium]|nr:DUF2309 domain-containing protein [Bryobacteraceae bacterium]